MKKITILFLLSVLIGGLSNGFGQEKIFFSAIPTDSTNLNIYSMNIDGSNQQILFNDDYNRYHPDITNDKSKLVYVRIIRNKQFVSQILMEVTKRQFGLFQTMFLAKFLLITWMFQMIFQIL